MQISRATYYNPSKRSNGYYTRAHQQQRGMLYLRVVLDLAADVARINSQPNLSVSLPFFAYRQRNRSLLPYVATSYLGFSPPSTNHYLAHVANNRLKSSDRVKPVWIDQCCNYLCGRISRSESSSAPLCEPGERRWPREDIPRRIVPLETRYEFCAIDPTASPRCTGTSTAPSREEGKKRRGESR